MKSFISDPEQVRVTFFQSYIHYRYKKLFLQFLSTYCGTFYEVFLDLWVPNRLKREGIVVWHPSKDLKISQIGRLPNPSRINDLLDLAWIIGWNGVHFSSKKPTCPYSNMFINFQDFTYLHFYSNLHYYLGD